MRSLSALVPPGKQVDAASTASHKSTQVTTVLPTVMPNLPTTHLRPLCRVTSVIFLSHIRDKETHIVTLNLKKYYLCDIYFLAIKLDFILFQHDCPHFIKVSWASASDL